MKSHSSAHSSSSSSSWLSFTTGEKLALDTTLPGYHSSLHSVRKPAVAKPTKKPIAPIPPTPPPRVYTVQALQFKQVVQMLTAAPEFHSSRLQKLAPSPLPLPQISPHVQQQPLPPPPELPATTHHHPPPLLNVKESAQPTAACLWPNTCSGAAADQIFEAKNSPSGCFGLLSPMSNVWSPFPLFSPGTISAFDF